MLKNKIKNIFVETNVNGDDYIVVYYTDESFKTYFVNEKYDKGHRFYSIDDNYKKDLNKILYYYYR